MMLTMAMGILGGLQPRLWKAQDSQVKTRPKQIAGMAK